MFEPRSCRGVLDTTLCDKFVSDLRRIGDFLRVLWFPHPINLTSTIPSPQSNNQLNKLKQRTISGTAILPVGFGEVAFLKLQMYL